MALKLSPGRHTLLAVSLLALTGCGGGSSSSSNNSNNTPQADRIQGTAAIGAAIVNGTVTAKCSGSSGSTHSATTDNDGRWSIDLSNASELPCALQVSWGSPARTLHSYALTTGSANITPLTDLTLAMAVGGSPANWFANATQLSSNTLDTARDSLRDTLNTQGYNLPQGDFFTSAFQIGDVWDRVLDRLGEAISANANLSYDSLLTMVAEGNLSQIPAAPAVPEVPDVSEGFADLDVLTQFAGTYTVSGTATEPAKRGTATRNHERGTITIGANGNVDFDTGIAFTAAEIGAIYDRTMLTGDSRRVVVNYDADDSGRSVQIYLNDDKQVVEIRYSDGKGGITRAAISSGANQGVDDNGSSDNGGGNNDGQVNYSQLQGKNGIALRPNNGGSVILVQGASEWAAPANGVRRFRFGYQIGAWELDRLDQTRFNGALVGDVRLYINAQAGTHDCAVSGSELRIQLSGTNPWNGNFTAKDCSVVVEYGTALGGLRGYIASATLENANKTASFTLTNAPFQMYRHVGTEGEPAPLDRHGYVTMYVEAPGVFELPGNQHFVLDNMPGTRYGISPDDGTVPFTGNASDVVTLNLNNNSAILYIGRYLGELVYSSANGGNHTRTETGKAGSYSWGTYESTLVATPAHTNATLTAAERTIRIRGQYRNFMLNPVVAGNDGDEGALATDQKGVTLSIVDGNAHYPQGNRYRYMEDNMNTVSVWYATGEAGTRADIRTSRHVKASMSGVEVLRIPTAVGTYTCANDNVSVRLKSGQGVDYYTHNAALLDGASCTVTVDQVTPTLKGSYTARVKGLNGVATIMPDAKDSVDISGTFELQGQE